MIEKLDNSGLGIPSQGIQTGTGSPVADQSVSNPNTNSEKPSVTINVASGTSKLSELNKKTLAEKQLNLQQAVKEINLELESMQSEIGFSVDFETNKDVVTVTRKDSGEIVRQIPSETVLNVAHNIEKLKGILFDKLI